LTRRAPGGGRRAARRGGWASVLRGLAVPPGVQVAPGAPGPAVPRVRRRRPRAGRRRGRRARRRAPAPRPSDARRRLVSGPRGADELERRYLGDIFAELCRIESPSGRERACAQRVAAELRALGLEVREDGAGPA